MILQEFRLLIKMEKFISLILTKIQMYIFSLKQNPIHTIENNKTTVKTDGFNNQLQIKIASIKNE